MCDIVRSGPEVKTLEAEEKEHGLSTVDKRTPKTDHAYFEKFKAKGANRWDGTNMFNQMGTT